ncbi:MAG: 4Fe-4S dicluster domain-containing protein [Spirochaetaceae bacterium]
MENRGFFSKGIIELKESNYKSIEDITFSKLLFLVLNRQIGIEKSIIIDFTPSFPISLKPEYQYEIFISKHLKYFKDFLTEMGLESISYSNIDFELPEDDTTKIVKNVKKTLLLSAFSFYKLIDSYVNKHVNSSYLIHQLHDNTVCESQHIVDKSGLAFPDYYEPLSGELFNEKLNDFNYELSLVYKNYTLTDKGELIKKEFIKKAVYDCINCNLCNKNCPLNIYPQFYYHYLEADFIEDVEKLLITKCNTCGICSFVCPSNIPITQKISEYLNEREE